MKRSNQNDYDRALIEMTSRVSGTKFPLMLIYSRQSDSVRNKPDIPAPSNLLPYNLSREQPLRTFYCPVQIPALQPKLPIYKRLIIYSPWLFKNESTYSQSTKNKVFSSRNYWYDYSSDDVRSDCFTRAWFTARGNQLSIEMDRNIKVRSQCPTLQVCLDKSYHWIVHGTTQRSFDLVLPALI